MESKPMNVRTIAKRIEKIEEKVAPQPKVDLVVVWWFGALGLTMNRKAKV
jgi:hypothetical protein